MNAWLFIILSKLKQFKNAFKNATHLTESSSGTSGAQNDANPIRKYLSATVFLFFLPILGFLLFYFGCIIELMRLLDSPFKPSMKRH